MDRHLRVTNTRGRWETPPENEPKHFDPQNYWHYASNHKHKTERNQARERKYVPTRNRNIRTPFPRTPRPFSSIERSKLSLKHTVVRFLWQLHGLVCIQKRPMQLVQINTSSPSTSTRRLQHILYSRLLALLAKQYIVPSLHSPTSSGQGHISSARFPRTFLHMSSRQLHRP